MYWMNERIYVTFSCQNGHVKHQMNGIQMNGVSGGTVIEKPPATSMTNGDALAPLPQPPPTAHNDDMQLFDKFQVNFNPAVIGCSIVT